MDTGILTGFIGLGFMSLVQLASLAYVFGRIKQKVDDIGNRVSRLEFIQNGKDRDSRRKAQK